MSEWITVKEASNVLHVSERHVRRLIQNGNVKAKKKGRIWLVLVSNIKSEEVRNDVHDKSEIMSGLQSQIDVKDQEILGLKAQLADKDMIADLLRTQLEEKDQQINQQQAIIMQLSRNQQMILESSEQKKLRGWWSRLWKRDTDTKSG